MHLVAQPTALQQWLVIFYTDVQIYAYINSTRCIGIINVGDRKCNKILDFYVLFPDIATS